MNSIIINLVHDNNLRNSNNILVELEDAKKQINK